MAQVPTRTGFPHSNYAVPSSDGRACQSPAENPRSRSTKGVELPTRCLGCTSREQPIHPHEVTALWAPACER